MSNTFIYYGSRAFNLRVDPNSISWNCSLNVRETDTLGGKVIQVLSANIDDLSVKADCGVGGFAELQRVADFFRDLILWQRASNNVAKFVYEPRNYSFSVVGDSMTVTDGLSNTAYPYTLTFKIQEDLSGVATQQTISQQLADIHEGMDWQSNEYNTPSGSPGLDEGATAQDTIKQQGQINSPAVTPVTTAFQPPKDPKGVK